MKRILLLSAFLIFMSMPISIAQSLRTVEGRVVNENGVPIEGATITVKNYEQNFSSDANGNFSIKIPYGYNYITATYPDHTVATAEIDGSYVILKLKYDAAGVKSREEARLKAQQDSIKAASAAAALAAATAAKAEKERIAAEERARKEAEAKAQAEAATAAKAEKERIAAEERARKEAEAKAQAESAAAAKAEKERIAAEERARKKADAKAKDEEYDKKFKNKGLSHSIDFSYGYEFSQSDCLCYKYSGYRSYGNLSPMQLTYTLSYKFNRLVSLGIGTGVLYNAKSITIVNDSFAYPNENFQEKRLDVPVFMNLKLNFLRTKIRPYLSLSGGYYILSGTPMGEGGLGCEMRFARHYAFRVQASAALTPWPCFSSKNSPAKYTPAFNTGVKIGFDF